MEIKDVKAIEILDSNAESAEELLVVKLKVPVWTTGEQELTCGVPVIKETE